MLLTLALLACEPTKLPDTGPGNGPETALETGPDSPADTEDSTPVEDSAETGPDSTPPETADSDEPWPGSGAACVLVSDLATPNFLEGDTVSFTVSCSGDLATEDAEITAVDLPDGASFDADTRAFTWETGPADGGRADVVFSVKPKDGSGEIPSAETVTFWVADDASAPGNVAVTPATYTEEWGLPVVHLKTTGPISTSYASATVTWYGTEYDANLKIRGASSSYYPKPSYTLEFNEDELPMDAWGVTRDHLLLLSTFDDNSYVRQKLVYDLWAAIAEHWEDQRMTPRTQFVVVYKNGSYFGLYVALDRMDNEFLDHMGFERDANLYKATNHNANFFLTNVYGSAKTSLHDGYTKEEGEPEDDFDDLDELVAFTGGSSATPCSPSQASGSTCRSSWTGSCWSTTRSAKTARARTPICTTRWRVDSSATAPGTSTTPGARAGTPTGSPRRPTTTTPRPTASSGRSRATRTPTPSCGSASRSCAPTARSR